MRRGTQRDATHQNSRSPPPDNCPRIKQEPQEPPRITGVLISSLGVSQGVAIHETPERIMLAGRSGTKVSTIRAQFTVVNIADPSYNGLIGRPILTALRAIVSPVHLKMKFPTPGGIWEVCGDQNRARICYQTSVPPLNKGPNGQDRKRSRENHMEINMRKEKPFRIGTKLGEEHEQRLIALVREFEDVFVWGPEDMPGIDPAVATNKLYVDPTFSPIKQKRRIFKDKKNIAIREEVQTLLKAQAIRELKFPAWIANVVVVKKA
ncbi:hypothetical protein LIER_13398 [Lithospermum erythrorhizon]|uniref:Reverse transcriptase domain-containing protein n=1 Tax=Lithospermum erythrorhizon TaxID=34254 RepID=A0AAV3PXF5_LITER